MVTSSARHRARVLYCSIVVVASAAALSLSGCAPAGARTESGDRAAELPAPTATPTDAESAGHADVFAERDAFIREQRFPNDGSPLVPVTDAQKLFIAEQSEYILSQGGEWDAQNTSIALALASDACETAILNRHDVDEMLLDMHVSTSPLFEALIPADTPEGQRALFERNVAGTMVFGTKFLCPDDYDAWQSAYEMHYSEGRT